MHSNVAELTRSVGPRKGVDTMNSATPLDPIVGGQAQDLPSLLAASCIQFIDEDTHGLQSLHETWTGSGTNRLLETATSLFLDELDLARNKGASACEAEEEPLLWQARFAAQSGDDSRTQGIALNCDSSHLTKQQHEISLLSALWLGDFDRAASLMPSTQESGISQSLLSWAAE